jgi:serine/threonine protein kinase
MMGSPQRVYEMKYWMSDQGIPAQCLKEISTLKLLSHPSIGALDRVERFSDHVLLTYDISPSASASASASAAADPNNNTRGWHRLSDLSSDALRELRVTPQGVAAQLFAALAHCHARGVAHRAVNPHSVAVSGGGALKLLGFSAPFIIAGCVVPHDTALAAQTKHSYMSPEALYCALQPTMHFTGGMGMGGAGEDAGPLLLSSDVWAASCLCLDVVRAQASLGSASPLCQINDALVPTAMAEPLALRQLTTLARLCGVSTSPMPPPWAHPSAAPMHTPAWAHAASGLGDDGNNFLQATLQYNPMMRITAEDILSHPYLSSYGAAIAFASESPSVAQTVFSMADVTLDVDMSDFTVSEQRKENYRESRAVDVGGSFLTPVKVLGAREGNINIQTLTEQHEFRKMRLREAASISLDLPRDLTSDDHIAQRVPKRRLAARNLIPDSFGKVQKMLH